MSGVSLARSYAVMNHHVKSSGSETLGRPCHRPSFSTMWFAVVLPGELSATTIAFWRMLLASLMAFAISYKTVLTFVPNKKILLAGVFLGFHFVLFFRGVQLTSVAEATLLGTIAPVFTEF